MKTKQGFTVVEILITLLIGMLLLLSAYQLYGYVLRDSGEARTRAIASSIAYENLRNYSLQVSNPCAPSSFSPSVPANTLAAATTSVTIACAINGPSSMSLVTSSVTYGTNTQLTVTHATYVRAN